jgi:predicted amidohydrolase
MRSVKSLEDFLDQVEFFVDAMAGYQSDFVLFPEFFNAPLMALHPEESPESAIRTVAGYTDEIVEKIGQMAVRYNTNIIAGSMPEYRDHALYNTSYLCRRDGTQAFQKKLHITPDEEAYWGMQGGNKLSVFETDTGRIGVLICFDVEFPELPRLLAEHGVDILFVPYWTDTKNAYLRVRRCAQARAIENECYVAISGSVGNLPKVENMDIQYSQAAVFSPSDYAFAHDATIAEATPNTELTLVADLDVRLLRELRERGSVRNLRSRRKDLYSLQWKGAKEDFVVLES